MELSPVKKPAGELFRPWITTVAQTSTPNSSHLFDSFSTVSVSPCYLLTPSRTSEELCVTSTTTKDAADQSDSVPSTSAKTKRNLFDAFATCRGPKSCSPNKNDRDDEDDYIVISSSDESLMGCQTTWDYSSTPAKRCHPDCRYCKTTLISLSLNQDRQNDTEDKSSRPQHDRLIKEDFVDLNQSDKVEYTFTPCENQAHRDNTISDLHQSWSSQKLLVPGDVAEMAIAHDHNYNKLQCSTPVLKIHNVCHISQRQMEDLEDSEKLQTDKSGVDRSTENLNMDTAAVNRGHATENVSKSPAKPSGEQYSIGFQFHDQHCPVESCSNTTEVLMKNVKDIGTQTEDMNNMTVGDEEENQFTVNNKENGETSSRQDSDPGHSSTTLTIPGQLERGETEDRIWSSSSNQHGGSIVELAETGSEENQGQPDSPDPAIDERFTPSSTSPNSTPNSVAKKRPYKTETEQLVLETAQFNSRFRVKASPRCLRCHRIFRSERLLSNHFQHHDMVHTRSGAAKERQKRRELETMGLVNCSLDHYPQCFLTTSHPDIALSEILPQNFIGMKFKSCVAQLNSSKATPKRHSSSASSKVVKCTYSSSSSERQSTPHSKILSNRKQAVLGSSRAGPKQKCKRNIVGEFMEEDPLVIGKMTPKKKCVKKPGKNIVQTSKVTSEQKEKWKKKKAKSTLKKSQLDQSKTLTKGIGRPKKDVKIKKTIKKSNRVKKNGDECDVLHRNTEENTRVKEGNTKSREINDGEFMQNKSAVTSDAISEIEILQANSPVVEDNEDDNNTIIYNYNIDSANEGCSCPVCEYDEPCTSPKGEAGRNPIESKDTPTKEDQNILSKSESCNPSPRSPVKEASPLASKRQSPLKGKALPAIRDCYVNCNNKEYSSSPEIKTSKDSPKSNKRNISSPSVVSVPIIGESKTSKESSPTPQEDKTSEIPRRKRKTTSKREVRSITAAQRGVRPLTRAEIENAFKECSVTLCKIGVDTGGCVYRGEGGSPIQERPGTPAAGITQCKTMGGSGRSTPVKDRDSPLPEDGLVHNESLYAHSSKENEKEIIEKGKTKKKKVKEAMGSPSLDDKEGKDSEGSENSGICSQKKRKCNNIFEEMEKRLDRSNDSNLMPLIPADVVRDAMHGCELDFEAALVEMQLINEGLPPFVGDKCYIEAVKKRALQGTSEISEECKENVKEKSTKKNKNGKAKLQKKKKKKLKMIKDSIEGDKGTKPPQDEEAGKCGKMRKKKDKGKKLKRKANVTLSTKETGDLVGEDLGVNKAETTQAEKANKESESSSNPVFKIVWNKAGPEDPEGKAKCNKNKKTESKGKTKPKKKHDQESLVRCHYCDEIMARCQISKHTLHSHPFPCRSCKLTFSKKKLRDNHIEDVHTDIVCNLCQQNFTKVSSLKQHLNTKKHKDFERIQKQTIDNLHQKPQHLGSVSMDSVSLDSLSTHQSTLQSSEDQGEPHQHSVLSDSFLAEFGFSNQISMATGSTTVPSAEYLGHVQPFNFHQQEEGSFYNVSPQTAQLGGIKMQGDPLMMSYEIHRSQTRQDSVGMCQDNQYPSWQGQMLGLSDGMVNVQQPWQPLQSCEVQDSRSVMQDYTDEQSQLGSEFGFLAALDLVNL